MPKGNSFDEYVDLVIHPWVLPDIQQMCIVGQTCITIFDISFYCIAH